MVMVDEDLGVFVKGTDVRLRYNRLHGFILFECPHKSFKDGNRRTICKECASVVASKLVEMGFAERKRVK